MKKYLLLLLIIHVFIFSGCDDKSTTSDNVAPEVVITSPVDGTEITAGQIVTIRAEASDNKEIEKVEFKINGELKGEDKEEPYMYEWNTSEISKTYNLIATAWDTSGNTRISEIISIIAVADNNPPDKPENPNPNDGAEDVSIDTNLSWSCTDSDGDDITYDVFWGINPTPGNDELIAIHQSIAVCNPPRMGYETTYYWKVVATDGEYRTEGNVWSYTTGQSEIFDITVPEDFEYQTTRLIRIIAQAPATRTLQVKRENGAVLYKGLIDLLNGFDQNILIPSTITTLNFEYNEQVLSRNIDLSTISIELEFTENGSQSIVDIDEDGVPDEEDEFPCDQERAYKIGYPANTNNVSNSYGTIAFEDNWPYYGDFDFNDVIVNYSIEECLNSYGGVNDVWMDIYYSVDGSIHNNGFYIKLPFQEDEVSSISCENDYFYDSDGQIVICIFEETDDLMPYPPAYHNTEEGSSFYEPFHFSVEMTLSGFSSYQERSIEEYPPYNPFLIIDQDISREIHLTNYPPTDRASTLLFGTVDDASYPASGIYYVTSSGLTWGLHIPELYNHPYEDVQIIDAYPNIVEWITSGGENCRDWFIYPEQGYVYPFIENVEDIFE